MPRINFANYLVSLAFSGNSLAISIISILSSHLPKCPFVRRTCRSSRRWSCSPRRGRPQSSEFCVQTPKKRINRQLKVSIDKLNGMNELRAQSANTAAKLTAHSLNGRHHVIGHAFTVQLRGQHLPLEDQIPVEAAAQLRRGGNVPEVIEADDVNHRRDD